MQNLHPNEKCLKPVKTGLFSCWHTGCFNCFRRANPGSSEQVTHERRVQKRNKIQNQVNTVKNNFSLATVALLACLATPVAVFGETASKDDSKAAAPTVTTSNGDSKSATSTDDSKSSDSSKSTTSTDGSKSSDSSKSTTSSDKSNSQADGNKANVSAVTEGSTASATSGTVSAVQSKADPMGLKIVGPTRIGGSDAPSANFQNNVLPAALQFIKQTLPESKNNTAAVNAMPLDPTKLTLATTENVRAYFVYEGAGFVNSLGVNTAGASAVAGNPELIFPAVRSSESAFSSAPYGTRTSADPLLPGDFVNLGVMQAGTKLDFFLLANGANGGTAAWNTAGAGANPDGINHVAAFNPRFFAVPQMNSPYLFISFEDLWGGGDKDYNDAIFAINVGSATINKLLATPEPSTYMTLGSFLGAAILVKRQSDRRRTAAKSTAA
jgi:Domain of unknown function (DUF4114)